MMIRAALLAAATLSLSTLAAFHSNDTACTRKYTVVSGDTCDRIGQKTLTSTYQILAFNLPSAGPNCYTLEIGAELCLGRYGNDCQFVHQCTNSDTCASIASQYGISIQRLQNNNPSLNCDIVYEGLMLCVSAGSIRPPADSRLSSTNIMASNESARQAWLATNNSTAAKRNADQTTPPSISPELAKAMAPRIPHLAANVAHQQRHRSISTRSHHRS